MLSQIYPTGYDIENGYKAIIATGYRTVVLDSSLQNNYEWYKTSKTMNVDHVADTDDDGLCDYQEIMFEKNGMWLIDVSDTENVKLRTYSAIISDLGDELFYVKQGLERYCESTGENSKKPKKITSLLNVNIMPINSDPTNPDGDEDGINDIDDPNKIYTDVYIFSLKNNSYIDINYNSGNSFGGSQSWFSSTSVPGKKLSDFKSEEEYDMYGLRRNGCGIIASCDSLLYLAKNESE